MKIRKQYSFQNTHIVRNCSSERCKKSIHSHVYEVEVFFEADKLDNGMMIMDFGLTKGTIKDFINIFKNSYTVWTKEKDHFKKTIKEMTNRWVELEVSPSAESFSLVFLKVISEIIKNTQFQNGEKNVRVTSVRVHETRTGYAESFIEDLNNNDLPIIKIEDIKISDEIKKSMKNPNLLEDIISGNKFINPKVLQQV